MKNILPPQICVTALLLLFIPDTKAQTDSTANGSKQQKQIQQAQEQHTGAEQQNNREQQLIIQKLNQLLENSDQEYIGMIRLYAVTTNVYYSIDALTQANAERQRDIAIHELNRLIKNGQIDKFNKTPKPIPTPKSAVPLRTIDIDSIELNVSEGLIERIRVTSKDGRIFRNYRPAPIGYFEKEKTFLYNIHNSGECIIFNEFVNTHLRADQNFLPDDDLIILRRPDDEMRPLKLNVNLSSHLDVRLYSDMLALFNQESNGLVQTEVTTRFIYNPYPEGMLYMFNFFEPSFRYSKFDSKFKNAILSDKTPPYTLSSNDQLNLNQLAFINLGLKINIIE